VDADLIDTADMPTEHGSGIYKGSQPGVDAAVVGICRAAGASILGKAVSHPRCPPSPHLVRCLLTVNRLRLNSLPPMLDPLHVTLSIRAIHLVDRLQAQQLP
jgi:hypothetical protein